jgi:hypothetical protein
MRTLMMIDDDENNDENNGIFRFWIFETDNGQRINEHVVASCPSTGKVNKYVRRQKRQNKSKKRKAIKSKSKWQSDICCATNTNTNTNQPHSRSPLSP